MSTFRLPYLLQRPALGFSYFAAAGLCTSKKESQSSSKRTLAQAAVRLVQIDTATWRQAVSSAPHSANMTEGEQAASEVERLVDIVHRSIRTHLIQIKRP
jgi:hypothetical protein